jgi:hypothetical protein
VRYNKADLIKEFTRDLASYAEISDFYIAHEQEFIERVTLYINDIYAVTSGTPDKVIPSNEDNEENKLSNKTEDNDIDHFNDSSSNQNIGDFENNIGELPVNTSSEVIVNSEETINDFEKMPRLNKLIIIFQMVLYVT